MKDSFLLANFGLYGMAVYFLFVCVVICFIPLYIFFFFVYYENSIRIKFLSDLLLTCSAFICGSVSV